MTYITTVEDPHWRAEELQWARILSTGDAARGMALVYLQKMCTTFHEFEPAVRSGAVDAGRVGFFRSRLAARVRVVGSTMAANGLDTLDGFAQLQALLHTVESAETAADLANLAETVHLLGHRLCDALEGGAMPAGPSSPA